MNDGEQEIPEPSFVGIILKTRHDSHKIYHRLLQDIFSLRIGQPELATVADNGSPIRIEELFPRIV